MSGNESAKGKGAKRKTPSTQVHAHPVTSESVKEKKVISQFNSCITYWSISLFGTMMSIKPCRVKNNIFISF